MSTIDFTLNGRPETLKVSLGAARLINHTFGGYQDAMQRVTSLDFNAFVVIVAAGMDKPGKDVEESVFLTGLDELVAPVSKFIALLMRGGRSVEAADATSGKS